MSNKNLDLISFVIAKKILGGFEQHYQNMNKASIEAKRCFEKMEWEKIENDSKLRMNFYEKQVKRFCKILKNELIKEFNDEKVDSIDETASLGKFNSKFWKSTKLHYVELITGHNQPELAETFYNSVFCRLYARRFYNNQYIFTKPCVSLNYIDMDDPVIESYFIEPGQLNKTFAQILKSFSFNCNFKSLKRDASRLEEQFYQQVDRLTNDVFEIQVINTPFIRGKGAYIVGKIV